MTGSHEAVTTDAPRPPDAIEGRPSLLEQIESAASATAAIHFIPDGTRTTVAEIWSISERAARWLAGRSGETDCIAVVLDSSPEALATLLGAWRSGRRVVSLPMPPRGSALELYQEFVERTCASTCAAMLVVAAEYLPLLPPLGVPVVAFESVGQGSQPSSFTERPEKAELAQFTSGSTSDPKGVLLGMRELGANVAAILEVLEPAPGDGACSWLPLSHDMGLVGMALSSIVGSGPGFADGGDIVLIKPDQFLRRPETWLRACSDFRSTITAAPDFGFAHAVRRADALPVELDALRVCITGAEPVRPETLRSFHETFAPAGFDEGAFCPAYGLAEAGVAVTMTRPGERWSVAEVELDSSGVDDRRGSGTTITSVSAGRPLPGYEISCGADPTSSDAGPQLLSIRAPSLLRGYLPGEPRRTPWFETNDLAVIRDGELFVTGRADDVVVLGGRNLHLADIEYATARGTDVPSGRLQGIADGHGYTLVVEEQTARSHDRLASEVRRAAVAAIGWGAESIVVTERGRLPRTSSGKPRRAVLRDQLATGCLPILHQLDARR